MKNRKSKSTKNPATTQKLLSLTFPVSRTISSCHAYEHLFEGMLLEFRHLEFYSPIAITAYYLGESRIIGFLPVGMRPHLDDLLLHEDSYCVQLERIDCERLENSMWITVEALPELHTMGLEMAS